jgi:hypothetical protein
MPIWWERVRHLLSMTASEHSTLPDLRGLAATPVRVTGTHFRMHDPERGETGDRLVNGLGTEGGSIRVWIDLPAEASLRAFVEARPPQAPAAV